MVYILLWIKILCRHIWCLFMERVFKNAEIIQKSRIPREVCSVMFPWGQACRSRRMCLVFEHYFWLCLRRIYESLTKHYLLFGIDLFSWQHYWFSLSNSLSFFSKVEECYNVLKYWLLVRICLLTRI